MCWEVSVPCTCCQMVWGEGKWPLAPSGPFSSTQQFPSHCFPHVPRTACGLVRSRLKLHSGRASGKPPRPPPAQHPKRPGAPAARGPARPALPQTSQQSICSPWRGPLEWPQTAEEGNPHHRNEPRYSRSLRGLLPICPLPSRRG